MGLRFQILFVFTFLLSHFSQAQSDSSDLNFYALQPVLSNNADSILYDNGNLENFLLEFDLTDTLNVSKIWIELVMTDFESNSMIVFSEKYNLEQLSIHENISLGNIQLFLGSFYGIYTYQVFIAFEDKFGHQKKSISKFLAS